MVFFAGLLIFVFPFALRPCKGQLVLCRSFSNGLACVDLPC